MRLICDTLIRMRLGPIEINKAEGFNYAFENLNPLGCLGIVSAE
jgi:hypothetical protein